MSWEIYIPKNLHNNNNYAKFKLIQRFNISRFKKGVCVDIESRYNDLKIVTRN